MRLPNGGVRSVWRRESKPAEAALPVWLAALAAAGCLVHRNGARHGIQWTCLAGRAVYTNSGAGVETIHPLGVSLEAGQTLAVSWPADATGYTMEILGRNSLTA